MLKILKFIFLAALGGTAMAQTTERPERWATSVCDMMSPEEMRVCLATKPGDATGVRGTRCDEIAQHQIEMCLQQAEKSGQASSGATRETSSQGKEGKIPAPSPKKE
jgi:hypothetical protein